MQKYIYKLQQVKDLGIKYILSIGKRQPMHIGHKKTLEKILSIKKTKLIYVIGSANKGGDPLFNPFVNPLNIYQQIEQFKFVFPNKEVIFLPIIDVADMSKWGPSIINSLSDIGINPEECVMHFVGKPEDKLKDKTSFYLLSGEEVTLNPGQWLVEAMGYYGFTLWLDNEIEADLSISARNLRELDLENLTDEQKIIISCPNFLLKIAKEARENNPDKDNLTNDPITLKDLSLQRLRLENI